MTMPQLPFGFGPRRLLAVFAALLLLVVLFLLRNVRPVSYFRGRKAVIALVFVSLVLGLGYDLVPFAIAQRIAPIVILSVLLFSGSLSCALAFVLGRTPAGKSETAGLPASYQNELAIAVVIVWTALPLLTQSYFYHDDWWSIGTGVLMNAGSVIALGRPIHILLYDAFPKISIANAFLLKWVFLPALVMYAVVLYRWLLAKTGDNVLALCLAGLLTTFAPAMDLLGYSSTSAVCYSILFSALSVVCFERAWECRERREMSRALLNAVLALFLLFTAFLTYQIGTEVVFVLLSTGTYFARDRSGLFKRNLVFLLLFSMSAAMYLVFVKLSTWIYRVPTTTNRAVMIGSIDQVAGKLSFYGIVIGQSLKQIAAAFTGGGFIHERYHGAGITFTYVVAGQVAVYLVAVMILIGLAGYWRRTRSVAGLVQILIFLPMSYYVFLVLAESGYLTYYAFAHISLLMFYFLMGALECTRFGWMTFRAALNRPALGTARDFKPAYVLAPTLVICALVSNYYVRDFYVDYNRTLYAFVKYSLQAALKSGNIKRIHVVGSTTPGSADIYGGFVTWTALKDLGRKIGDYHVTYSLSPYFLDIVERADYLKIYAQLSIDDQQELDRMYVYQPSYQKYVLRATPSSIEEKQLQRVFEAAGAIPAANAPETVVIDLTWTNVAYVNARH